MNPVLLPAAKLDLRNAASYYKVKAGRPVAWRFEAAFLAAVGLIADNPGIGSARLGNITSATGVRTWSLKGFPYLLFYRCDEENLYLIRLLHTARDIPAIFQE